MYMHAIQAYVGVDMPCQYMPKSLSLDAVIASSAFFESVLLSFLCFLLTFSLERPPGLGTPPMWGWP